MSKNYKGTKIFVPYDPKIHHRKSMRLKNYDYASNGYYFATICVKGKIEYFGKIDNGKIELSEIGKIANQCWLEIPKHFPNVKLDEHIIMPNHIHGILIIDNNTAGNKNFCSESGDNYCFKIVAGNKNFCSLRGWYGAKSRSLSSIIRGFKIGVTKWRRNNSHNEFQWQKSFYDHIIRDEKSLDKIREYIASNPAKWELDKNNPENLFM